LKADKELMKLLGSMCYIQANWKMFRAPEEAHYEAMRAHMIESVVDTMYIKQ
jgi:hypothetical protein